MKSATWLVLLIGIIVVLAILSKAGFERLRLPDLLGYLLIGVGLQSIDGAWGVLPPASHQLLKFLAEFGIVALLFRIGLECDLENLVRRLPGATMIWGVNMTVSLGAVFPVAFLLLDWPLLPSLFTTVALTATGIGVSVRVWRHADQLGSSKGALMLDTAELDDLSGIMMMALLTSLAPQLSGGISMDLAGPVVQMLILVLGKITVLVFAGFLFARHLEAPVTQWLHDIQPRPDFMITLLGMGLVVAGLTALFGFSAAIGGFFAGLIFSRNPLAVKIDASFDSLHDLFVPFFFVHVGFSLDLPLLVEGAVPFVVLLTVAVAGKGLGSFLPASTLMKPSSAGILAVALIPRSEITLIVMERGLDLGVVSQETFGVVVAVVAATMAGVPLALRGLFARTEPPEPEPAADV